MRHLKDIVNKMGDLRQSLKNTRDFYDAKISERQIRSFLKKNYNIRDVKITYNNNFFEVSSNSDVTIRNYNIESLTNGLFKWTEVKKNFDIAYSVITSLEGSPEFVGGNFECNSCDSLKSLEGAPKEVGGDFNCSWCESLTSLEGAPKEVGRDFDCSHCKSLTSLKGAPKEVGGMFSCDYCKGKFSVKDAEKVTKAQVYIGDVDFDAMHRDIDKLDKFFHGYLKSTPHPGISSVDELEAELDNLKL
jgi:transcription elongation factor Elf1